MAAKKPQSPAMEFLVQALKSNRKATYADLKAKADEKKLPIFPIMFGRAQALLGIVKSKKRGSSGGRGKGKGNGGARAGSGGGGAGRGGGGRPGRRPDASSKSARVRELLATGMSAADISKKVGCTTALVYNIKSTMARRGGARPARAGRGGGGGAAGGGIDGIAGILDAVKGAERERAQLRAALERIQAVIADALG